MSFQWTFREEDFSGFRKVQRLSYRCAVEIGRELKEGWTERQAASLMDTYLRDHGVKSFFHTSIAWFGERSRFDGLPWWKYSARYFRPSQRRLREGEVVILDTAPILEGYVGDIGYTFCLQEHEGLKRAKKDLRTFRERIPRIISSQSELGGVWQKVDRELKEMGYDNCHEKYPFSALGHRVRKMKFGNIPGVSVAGPFGFQAVGAFLSRGVLPDILGPKHKWTKNGFWAVEPHIGGNGFGAKFEEILVVDDDRVYWLDDEVPHLKELDS